MQNLLKKNQLFFMGLYISFLITQVLTAENNLYTYKICYSKV